MFAMASKLRSNIRPHFLSDTVVLQIARALEQLLSYQQQLVGQMYISLTGTRRTLVENRHHCLYLGVSNWFNNNHQSYSYNLSASDSHQAHIGKQQVLSWWTTLHHVNCIEYFRPGTVASTTCSHISSTCCAERITANLHAVHDVSQNCCCRLLVPHHNKSKSNTLCTLQQLSTPKNPIS